jgi:hypothetical protein
METTLNKKESDKEASDRIAFITFIIPYLQDEQARSLYRLSF